VRFCFQDAIAALPEEQRAGLQAGLAQAMGAGANGGAAQQNALMLFLRTLFRPDAAAGAHMGAPQQQQAQQAQPRPVHPPGAEGVLNEEGDSEEEAEEFEAVPDEWRREWAAARGDDAGAGGAGGGVDDAEQDWDAPD
jgi:hypothetical protein